MWISFGKIWSFIKWCWARVADISLVKALFPSSSTYFFAVFWGVVAAAIGFIKGLSPVFWLPLGFLVTFLALGCVHLVLSLYKRVSNPAQPKSVHRIEILFGDSAPYVSTKSHYVYGLKRTLFVCVKNNADIPVTNCELWLKDVDGRHLSGVEYPFTPRRFLLLPRTSQFLEIASYVEGLGSTPGAQKIELGCDISSISGGCGPGCYELDVGEHVLTLEAVCFEQAPVSVLCRLWVNEEGKLRIRRI